MVEALPTGSVALVTGATSGIGRAIVTALGDDGFQVVATDRVLPGGGDLRLTADLTDAACVPRLFDEAERTLGAVRVLVHNATASLLDTFTPQRVDGLGRTTRHLDVASFDGQFAVDARAGALLIAEFAARLHARAGRGGRIVALTSGGAGFPGEVSYGAAKAALVDFVLSAALELSADGVTANALHPPVTDTGWVNDDVRAVVAEDPRFFTVADGSEVADVVRFLASDAGRRVTGNVIRMG